MPLHQIIVDVFKAIGEHIRYDLFPYLSTSVWMVPVLAVLALLVWRLWTFTIVPLLYPDSPKIYPYWVPVLGHLLSFYRDPNGLQRDARKYFNYSEQPFSLMILGTQFYILTNPGDISEAYRNASSLSFEVFVRRLLRICGSSKSVVEKLYQSPQSPREHRGSLGQALHTLNVQQSTPGPNFEILSTKIRTHFEESLSMEKIANNSRFGLGYSTATESVRVSLIRWCAETNINATQNAYFGGSLSETDPNLAQTFKVFDERGWQLLYQYPRWFSRDMYSAKDQLVRALTSYFDLPADKKADAAWVTKYLEKEMRHLGLDSREMATLMMLQYWGMNTNVNKACFWMLSYMLYTPGLLALIREETAAAFVDGSLDMRKLETSCPRLEGLWLEVLRLTVSASSVRYVTKNMSVGGKNLRSGNILVNSCRQLHFNESVFGESAYDFNPERFVSKKKLDRSRSWKPFGGGVSLCPGQFIAKRSACMFIALVVRQLDIDLAYPQPFPTGNDKSPDLGVFDPEKDLILTLKQRPSSG